MWLRSCCCKIRKTHECVLQVSVGVVKCNLEMIDGEEVQNRWFILIWRTKHERHSEGGDQDGWMDGWTSVLQHRQQQQPLSATLLKWIFVSSTLGSSWSTQQGSASIWLQMSQQRRTSPSMTRETVVHLTCPTRPQKDLLKPETALANIWAEPKRK